jgi:hypothetical protein
VSQLAQLQPSGVRSVCAGKHRNIRDQKDRAHETRAKEESLYPEKHRQHRQPFHGQYRPLDSRSRQRWWPASGRGDVADAGKAGGVGLAVAHVRQDRLRGGMARRERTVTAGEIQVSGSRRACEFFLFRLFRSSNFN